MAAATCLSPQTRPARVQYAEGQCPGCMAGIVAADRAESADLKTLGMQCFPLYSLLLAAAGQGVTVNYLSLDIEGAELLVLQTLPWAEVDIEVITVETEHAGEVRDSSILSGDLICIPGGRCSPAPGRTSGSTSRTGGTSLCTQ